MRAVGPETPMAAIMPPARSIDRHGDAADAWGELLVVDGVAAAAGAGDLRVERGAAW